MNAIFFGEGGSVLQSKTAKVNSEYKLIISEEDIASLHSVPEIKGVRGSTTALVRN